MVGEAPNTGRDQGAAAFDGGWPAVEVSPSGAITSANNAFAQCLGLRAGELRGASFLDLVHAEDRDRAVALLSATMAQSVELRLIGA
jgi:PAS domain S-box-containing protein